MAIKTYRPTTPTLRFQTTLTNEELTTNRPHKPLTQIKRRTGGAAECSGPPHSTRPAWRWNGRGWCGHSSVGVTGATKTASIPALQNAG